MRNYEYISKQKLSTYFPQAMTSRVANVSKKVKLAGGIAAVEIGEEQVAIDSDHHKIEAILAHLEEEKLVGDIHSEQPWFEAKVTAQGITTGRAVIFVSRFDSEGKVVYLLLLASSIHLAGYDAKFFSDLSFHEKRSPVGRLGLEYFTQNSNTLGYARSLRNAFKAEDLAEALDYDFKTKSELLRASHQLHQFELDALNEKPEFNESMIKIWSGDFWRIFKLPPEPPQSPWQIILNVVRVPILKWRLGDLYEQKFEAVQKQYRYERIKDSSLTRDENEILQGAVSVARSKLDGYERRYETTARVLLRGATKIKQSGKEIDVEVIIASPLYLSSI